MSRKQQLLKRHRRNKRIGLLIALALLISLGVLVAWWLPLIVAVLAWVAHEAWFADHLFYSPRDDYQCSFPPYTPQPKIRLDGERLLLDDGVMLADDTTLILALRVKSGWLGRFLDPAVELLGGDNPDRQVFERGVNGLRYLNLSGQAQALSAGQLRLRGRHCQVHGEPLLWSVEQPDYRRQRVMVIAPHADDAELAAYGLYSQADETWIVTLTAGEIEAEHYQQMGLSTVEASRLKGRLRAWDSIAVPRWAGVPEAHCVQLGYFCLQLAAMQAAMAAGGEAGPVHSAAMKIAGDVSWPIVDLRVDWADEAPIDKLEALWHAYKPQMQDYLTRALNPTAAPSYGVPGDE